jgi:hypothetical protein
MESNKAAALCAGGFADDDEPPDVDEVSPVGAVRDPDADPDPDPDRPEVPEVPGPDGPMLP